MGVNATETLGVAGRAPKTRESRRRRRRGGCGLGRGCAPSQKIYEFFISKWCDMVHSGCVVLRFICPMDCSCVINFIEVPEVKHLTKYWRSSTQDDPCRSNIGGRDPCVCNPCGVDAYACSFNNMRTLGLWFSAITQRDLQRPNGHASTIQVAPFSVCY